MTLRQPTVSIFSEEMRASDDTLLAYAQIGNGDSGSNERQENSLSRETRILGLVDASSDHDGMLLDRESHETVTRDVPKVIAVDRSWLPDVYEQRTVTKPIEEVIPFTEM